MSPEELREVFDQIDKVVPTQTGKLAGSILAAFSFALFYGGNLWDALLAGLAVVMSVCTVFSATSYVLV